MREVPTPSGNKPDFAPSPTFRTPHPNQSFQFLQHLKGCPSGTSLHSMRTISTLLRSQGRLSEWSNLSKVVGCEIGPRGA